MKEYSSFYRQEFYKKWGSYDNYLEYKRQNPKPPKLPRRERKFMKLEITKCKNCGKRCEVVGYYQYKSNKHFELIKYIGWDCSNCGLKEKITKEGQSCRHCGTPVIRRETKKHKFKTGQTYYFKAHLYCPGCKEIYMLEAEKVFIKNLIGKLL